MSSMVPKWCQKMLSCPTRTGTGAKGWASSRVIISVVAASSDHIHLGVSRTAVAASRRTRFVDHPAHSRGCPLTEACSCWCPFAAWRKTFDEVNGRSSVGAGRRWDKAPELSDRDLSCCLWRIHADFVVTNSIWFSTIPVRLDSFGPRLVPRIASCYLAVHRRRHHCAHHSVGVGWCQATATGDGGNRTRATERDWIRLARSGTEPEHSWMVGGFLNTSRTY